MSKRSFNVTDDRTPTKVGSRQDRLFKTYRGTLPRSIDLRSKMPPVLDQEELGSSPSFALTTAYQFSHPTTVLSPLFTHYCAGKLSDEVTLTQAMKAISTFGVSSESAWPYEADNFGKEAPATAFVDAKTRPVVSFSNLTEKIDSFKACLASGTPFVVSIKIYESFESDAVTTTGNVPLPKFEEKSIGGHAILMCGYDDATQTFMFMNSFGTSWGQHGFGTLPQQYLNRDNLISDPWIVQAGTKSRKIIKPVVLVAPKMKSSERKAIDEAAARARAANKALLKKSAREAGIKAREARDAKHKAAREAREADKKAAREAGKKVSPVTPAAVASVDEAREARQKEAHEAREARRAARQAEEEAHEARQKEAREARQKEAHEAREARQAARKAEEEAEARQKADLEARQKEAAAAARQAEEEAARQKEAARQAEEEAARQKEAARQAEEEAAAARQKADLEARQKEAQAAREARLKAAREAEEAYQKEVAQQKADLEAKEAKHKEALEARAALEAEEEQKAAAALEVDQGMVAQLTADLEAREARHKAAREAREARHKEAHEAREARHKAAREARHKAAQAAAASPEVKEAIAATVASAVA